MYSWAMKEGLCESNRSIATNDPAAGIPTRDRVLSDDEIRAIWTACRDDDFGRILKLLLLTGARRDEIGGLAMDRDRFQGRRADHSRDEDEEPSHPRAQAPRARARDPAIAAAPAGGLRVRWARRSVLDWRYSSVKLHARILEARRQDAARRGGCTI